MATAAAFLLTAMMTLQHQQLQEDVSQATSPA